MVKHTTSLEIKSELSVAFDISELGMHFSAARARRGIDRVVENVFHGLLAAPEIDLKITATHAAEGVRQFLAATPELGRLPFICSQSQAWIGKFTEFVRAYVRRSLPDRHWAKRILRRSLTNLIPYAQMFEKRLPKEALEDCDIFHSTYHGIPPTLRRLPRLRKFLTIYDLIPLHEPLMKGPAPATLRRALRSLLPEDWICCISQSVKDDICERLQFDPARVFVTSPAASRWIFYPCVDADAIQLVRMRNRIPEDTAYLLSLSAVEPRKNLAHLIDCFKEFVSSQTDAKLCLVLVGGQNPSQRESLQAHIAKASLQDKVIATGFLPDEELAALYSGALAFVFPSLAEGFGLPPLEAMQCGVPVISSNAASLPEVVGDAGLLVSPVDRDALCHSIQRIYNDQSLRRELSAASLRRAAEFSWERCVEETISAYRFALR